MPKSTEPLGGWTVETYAFHNEEMRQADQRFDEERDRRNVEIGIEREKALKIKETADRDAMSLARDAQTYKEKQNDALRDKTLGETGIYATNQSVSMAIEELANKLQPFIDLVTQQQGATKSTEMSWSKMFAVAGLAVALWVAYKSGGTL